MVLTIYTHPLSQPCRTVLMFCKAARIPYVEKHVDLATGEHKKPWFQKLNPMRQVPIIKDDTFILTESVAIVRYLIAKYEVNDHWYPADLQSRARIDQFLAWQHISLRGQIMNIYGNEVLDVQNEGKKVDQEKLRADLESLDESLQFLETHYLKDKEYIFGGEISIADLFAISEIMQPNTSGRDVLKNHRKLRQWFDLVRATLTPVFDEVHAELFKARDQFIANQQQEKREEKVKEIREIRRRESTEPEGEVIKLVLDDNIKPEPEQNGGDTGDGNNGDVADNNQLVS